MISVSVALHWLFDRSMTSRTSQDLLSERSVSRRSIHSLVSTNIFSVDTVLKTNTRTLKLDFSAGNISLTLDPHLQKLTLHGIGSLLTSLILQ